MRAAVTKYTDGVDYKSQVFIFRVLEGERSRSRCQQVWCPVRTSFPVHGRPLLAVLTQWKGQGALRGLYYKGTNTISEGSTLGT